MAEIQSPLSGGLNVARRTVSASAFVSAAPQPAPAQPDPVTTSLIERNSLSLNAVAAQLATVQQQVASLNAAMANVYGGIRQSTDLERNRDVQEQNQQRQLAEQQLREGKESIIERRIQNAVVAPVQKVSGKVQFTLSRLMGFFTTLLGGWLLNQGVQAIKAYSEGNKKRLEEIKNSVLKTLGIVGGIFAAIRFGLVGVFNVLTRLGARIASVVAVGLFVRPVQLLIDAVKGAGSKLLNLVRPAAKPPTPKPTANAPAKPGGAKPSGPGLIGGLTSAISAGMNLKSGENVDAAVNAAGFVPGPIGAGARVLSFADELAEVFGVRGGAGILGNTPRGGNKPDTKSQPTAKTQPKTTMAPSASDLQMSGDKPKGSETGQQSAEPDFSQPPEYGFVNIDVQAATGTEAEKMGSAAEGISANPLQTAQITPIKAEATVAAQSVGPLPEPTPTVLPMPMPSGQGNQPEKGKSGTTGSSQTVPSFNPENPNNFYIMYSHSVYNVPMMM